MCNSSRTREHDVLVIGLSGFISVKMFSNGFIFSFKFLSHVINHTLSRFSVSLTVSPCVLLFLSVIIYWGELLTVEFELNLLLVPAPALNFTLLFKDCFFFFQGMLAFSSFYQHLQTSITSRCFYLLPQQGCHVYTMPWP